MEMKWTEAAGRGWFLMIVCQEESTTAYAAYIDPGVSTYVTYTYGAPKTKRPGPQHIPAELQGDIAAAKRYVETMWRLARE